MLISYQLVVICCILSIVSGTLTPKNKKEKNSKQKELKVKVGPVGESVFERNLVDEEPLANSIIIENGAYFKETSERLFNGTILGYVTPVRNHFSLVLLCLGLI